MNNQRETGALWNGWLRNRIMSKRGRAMFWCCAIAAVR
ncbi:hypothetical protein SeW_A2632 [Salmonella enterica subsp. enterica serovar Weltevreden str. HI_N05-537]|nr:hypothetical protein SeW_A2632 [Salmonella enterica subsp. enterica serovar Weltevreden str. HI_N05-537]